MQRAKSALRLSCYLYEVSVTFLYSRITGTLLLTLVQRPSSVSTPSSRIFKDAVTFKSAVTTIGRVCPQSSLLDIGTFAGP
jgi:hypothetical protein